jgi:hypothetical protein
MVRGVDVIGTWKAKVVEVTEDIWYGASVDRLSGRQQRDGIKEEETLLTREGGVHVTSWLMYCNDNRPSSTSEILQRCNDLQRGKRIES